MVSIKLTVLIMFMPISCHILHQGMEVVIKNFNQIYLIYLQP